MQVAHRAVTAIAAIASVTVISVISVVPVIAVIAIASVIAGTGVFIPEPDVGNAIFGHIGAVIGIGDLVEYGILSGIGIVWSRCQIAVFRTIAVAD